MTRATSCVLAVALLALTEACSTSASPTLIDEEGGAIRPAGVAIGTAGQAMEDLGAVFRGAWDGLGLGPGVEARIAALRENELIVLGGLSVIPAEEPGALQVVSVTMYGYHLAAVPALAGDAPLGDPAYREARQLIFEGLNEEDPEDRVESFEESVRAFPTPGALNNLGLAWRQAGDADRAERLLLEALELRPDYVTARYNLERLRRLRKLAEEEAEREDKPAVQDENG